MFISPSFTRMVQANW